jgi:hypothetical protein
MRVILVLLLFSTVVPAHADLPPDPKKDALIASVMEWFWDEARNSSGELIRASADLDRHTIPIPVSVAYRAIEAGKISGDASQCHIRWIRHTHSISTSARKLGMSETQVAFVNALLETRQLQVMRSRRSPCSESDHLRAQRHLDKSTRLGLEVPTILRTP